MKMKCWCKIWYFSIKKKSKSKKKSLATYPIVFLVMIPEYNYFFVLALVWRLAQLRYGTAGDRAHAVSPLYLDKQPRLFCQPAYSGVMDTLRRSC